MSNTLLKVFQTEHGKYGTDSIGTFAFGNALNSDTISLNAGGEVYVLQPINNTFVDSCEVPTLNNVATQVETQSLSADATDLLQVRITQLPQGDNHQSVVAPLGPEMLNHLLSGDMGPRSVVDTDLTTANTLISAEKIKNVDGTALLWPSSDGKEAISNPPEVVLVPVMLGDNLIYIKMVQGIDNNEPIVPQLIPECSANTEGEDVQLDKGSAVLSFVVDNQDQIGGALSVSNLHQTPVIMAETQACVTESHIPVVPRIESAVKMKAPPVDMVTPLNKVKRGRSLLKGSVAAKQARAMPAQTKLCLSKAKKSIESSPVSPVMRKDQNSLHKVFHPKIQMVKTTTNDGELGKQQQSLAVVAISSDKTKDLTEIVVNTSKGKQIFKGKTSDLINAMSALMCTNNTNGQQQKIQKNNSSYDNDADSVEDEDDDEDGEFDQPVMDALDQLGTSLDGLISTNSAHERTWRCPEQDCSRVFQRLNLLKVHILGHYGVRPFKCDFPRCKWAFYTHFKLKRHKETHLKKKDFKCPNPSCNRSFTTVYNLKTHQKLHQRPAVLECPVQDCSSRFQTRRYLELHMREHGSDHAPYVCSVTSCGKRYYSLNSLSSHVRSHQHKEDEIRCQWTGCKKLFDKPCRLQAHMRIHTGDKPYRCTFPDCSWAFSSSSKLKRHQHKHTNVRKFACSVENCGKLFMRPEHLREHALTHSPGRPFRCSYNNCDGKFTAKSSLYVHMKKHLAHSKTSEETTNANKNTARAVTNRAPSTNASASTVATGGDVTVAAVRQSAESRIIYYCPVEDCDSSLESMAELKNHLFDAHSPMLAETSQTDVLRYLDGSLAGELDLQGEISANEESELASKNTRKMYLGRRVVDPRIATGQVSGPQNSSKKCGSLLLDPAKIPRTSESALNIAHPSARENRTSGCARMISYQMWRLDHPQRSSNSASTMISAKDPVPCVSDVPGLSELRVPSDVVLGGALLGSGHDNIAHLLLSEDLGGSALYDSEEGMLTMDSPFEPSTINLRDLE